VGVLDGLQGDIERTSARWIGPLQEQAQRLLFALLGISLFWRFVEATIRGTDFGGVVMELVRMVMVGGFFLAVIQFSPAWAHAVVQSFTGAAQLAQGGVAAPTTAGMVLAQGIDFVLALLDAATMTEKLLVGLLGGVILLMFAAISAYMLLVMAEMYIVTAGGVLLLGFGGSDWTSDFARRYLIYVVSVGAKLFALLLVVGFATGIFDTWTAGTASTITRLFALVGVVFVAMILVTMLPGMVQGIINGSSIGSGGPALTGMMTGVSSAVAGGVMSGVKMAAGARAATGAAVAGMGATSVREAVAKAGGGAGGAAKVGRAAASMGARGVLNAFGHRMAPAGSMVGELKGLRAAAEAMRDSPPPPPGGGKPD